MAVQIPAFLLPLREIEGASRAPAAALTRTSAATAMNPLPFQMPRQQLSNWCWAASTAGVQAYYREPFAKSQCEIASDWLGSQCCPPGPDLPSNPNNVTYNLETALSGNLEAPAIGTALSFDDLAREIDARRPLCCAIQWSNGEIHFNAVVGYARGQPNKVVVKDPKYGDHELPYDNFATRYRGNGTWIASLKTRKA